MTTKIEIAVLLTLVVSLASASEVYASPLVGNNGSKTYLMQGRKTVAPPWSFACMTDHGPSPCGAHVWVYGDVD